MSERLNALGPGSAGTGGTIALTTVCPERAAGPVRE
jgi:hypothetical protein